MPNNIIDSSEISVVVQGPIYKKETLRSLKSIKRFLPNVEIILSTWKGFDIEKLKPFCDEIILNLDPGAVKVCWSKALQDNNLNRQLLSTQVGIRHSSRKYILKLRSDLILTNNNFLNYFNTFNKRCTSYNLFKHRIITSCLFSRYNINFNEKNENVPMPFHVSDWWFFGLKEDIEKYFCSTPLAKEPDFSNYFYLDENKNKKSPYGDNSAIKFAPEQYYAYECFSQYYDDIRMEDASNVNSNIINASRIAVANNFIFLEFKQSGIYLNKYRESRNEKMTGTQYFNLYTFYRFEKEYKKYCDNGYQITTKDFCQKDDMANAVLKFYKHCYKLINKNTVFLQKLEQVFIGIPFSVVNLIIIYLKCHRGKKNGK